MVRTVSRRALAVVVSGVLGAGCSLVVALDGYTGGSSAASPDASIDARVDGVAPPPGSTDAGGDAPSQRRCDALRGKSTTLLCEDFDGPDPLSTWLVDKKATVDTQVFLSPSASLLASTPAVAGTGTTSAYVYRNLPPTSRVRASWALLADTACANGDLSSVGFSDANDHYFILQVVFGNDGSLYI